MEGASAKKPLRFRNYRPADASLAAPPPAAEDETATRLAAEGGKIQKGPAKEVASSVPPAGEAAVPTTPSKKKTQGEEEDVIKRELRKHIEEHGTDQLNVAPRKPNWDLKRDVAKKVEKLNRLTQKAIVELLREKLAKEAEEESSDEEDEGEEEEE